MFKVFSRKDASAPRPPREKLFSQNRLGRRFLFAIGITISIVMAGLFWWISKVQERQIINQVHLQARALFDQIVLTKEWLASQPDGGVYSKVTGEFQPNPYLLEIKDLKVNIVTVDGETYTLRNPEWITRELSETAAQSRDYSFRITGLDLKNPNNAPTEWEKQALESFESEKAVEAETIETDENGREILRYMAPLYMKESCLKCHTDEEEEDIGEIHGGISVTVPMTDARAAIRAGNLRLLLTGAGILSILLIFVGVLINFQISRPLKRLQSTALAISYGDLNEKATINSRDELGTLAETFNTMTDQMRELIVNLETRVKERTAELEAQKEYSEHRARQFETITQAARAISATQNLKELLPHIAEVISRQFGLYHVGVFLNDPQNEFAHLVAANSEGGKRMLERGHQLKIGEQGIVGYVAGSGQPRIALDVGTDSVYFNNPDLPETRSEMALPLKIGGEIIGALDVQSKEPNAFTTDDVEALSVLADQVSAAIQNARLHDQTRKSLMEAEALYRQYLKDSWSALPNQQKLYGFRYDANGAEPLQEATGENDLDSDTAEKKGAPRESIDVPISLRGEVIGALSVHIPNGDKLRAEQMDLIKAVAERVALSAENARLFDETTRRAERERLVTDITTKIRSANDPQEMINTAINELQRALGATRIELIPQKVVLPPEAQ